MRELVVVILLACVSRHSCQDYQLEGKIRKIWDYMDIDQSRYVTSTEIELFFSNMSNINGEVDFFNFDYSWGTWFDDSRDTTEFLFRSWDVFPTPPDNLLTGDDLGLLYLAVDDPAHSSSVGVLDYLAEFNPYFKTLYEGAWAISPAKPAVIG